MTSLSLPFTWFRPTAAWVAALCAAALTHAQPAPGSRAGAAISLAIDGAATSQTDFTARGASAGGFAVTQYGAKLKIPLPPLNGAWFPAIGLDYQHYDLDREAGTPLPDTLKSLGASFSVVGVPVKDWVFIASAGPEISNAGSGFTQRGLGFGLFALATRKFTSDFSAGFGVVYDSLSRGTGRILPVATFDWTPAPGWRAFLGFPRTGASWQINDALKAEFVAEADFGSFYVTDAPVPRSALRPALDRTRLEYQALRVGPAVTWKASPTFQTRVAVGAVPILNVDYHSRGYKLKSDDTAAFVSAELEWKF
ncbi:DUF6268 family outer membrane beta-barrel protein [Horticoccus sp. 23ND18S-11]|uniref:DUF6268 family outer membrane beta-barrel protein n=1 Tax=Horticoccus sp. 23ND18S-11 TaxID=3391832 RepID=UPI0039C8C62C